jgi:hypothetical protein
MKRRTLERLVSCSRACTLAASLGLIFPVAVAFGRAGIPLNAAPLLADIKTRGAEAVFAQLSQGEKWDELLRHVETEQTQWLQVVVQLQPATDHDSSALLTVAAGIALAKAPQQVLSMVVPALPLEAVCGLPDVSDLRFATKPKATRYLDARIAAVTRLNEPAIADLKMACLKSLQDAKQVIAAPDGPFS